MLTPAVTNATQQQSSDSSFFLMRQRKASFHCILQAWQSGEVQLLTCWKALLMGRHESKRSQTRHWHQHRPPNLMQETWSFSKDLLFLTSQLLSNPKHATHYTTEIQRIQCLCPKECTAFQLWWLIKKKLITSTYFVEIYKFCLLYGHATYFICYDYLVCPQQSLWSISPTFATWIHSHNSSHCSSG